MEQFPPNSQKQKAGASPNRERPERVTAAKARRRRTPLGKKFSQTFFSGDARTAGEYMVGNVLLPMLKDALFETLHSGLDRLAYGDQRGRRRGPTSMIHQQLGRIQYNQMSQMQRGDDRPPMPKMLSRQSKTRHDFGEIIITTRQEAEEVLDRLYDLVSKYDVATISDLYALTGIETSHTDTNWGWTELRGSGVGRIRGGGGYLLNLPEPEYLR